jgi:hypothetical protein
VSQRQQRPTAPLCPNNARHPPSRRRRITHTTLTTVNTTHQQQVKELQDELKQRGVAFTAKARKADLADLLTQAVAAEQVRAGLVSVLACVCWRVHVCVCVCACACVCVCGVEPTVR